MSAQILSSDLRFFGVCMTASLCIGLLFNQLRDHPLSLIYQSKEARLTASVDRISSSRATGSGEFASELHSVMTLEEIALYTGEKRGIILDARPEIFHRLGHIPGALSLPRDDFEIAYESLKVKLEENRAQPLVIYCSSSSCEDAELVRRALSALGYTNLAVFSGGWAEWTRAGNPEEKD